MNRISLHCVSYDEYSEFGKELSKMEDINTLANLKEQFVNAVYIIILLFYNLLRYKYTGKFKNTVCNVVYIIILVL